MQSNIVVVTPAASIDLIGLDEFKRALGVTGTTQDQMLGELITRVSAEIAAYCNNRVFGYETVVETFSEIPPDTRRLFLARYPVAVDSGITSIDNAGDALDPAGLLIDSLWGKLTLSNGGAFSEETVIEYSGGFDLPDQAPPALKQAATMLMREAYYAGVRGDASVRMIGHKESRVIYFDPNASSRTAGGGGGAGSPAQRAAQDLLTHFTRYEA